MCAYSLDHISKSTFYRCTGVSLPNNTSFFDQHPRCLDAAYRYAVSRFPDRDVVSDASTLLPSFLNNSKKCSCHSPSWRANHSSESTDFSALR
jgi:hypothetical protein